MKTKGSMSRREAEVNRRAGANLRTLRVAAGKTQEEIATAVGISYQQVQKYETAANRITLGKGILLAEAVGAKLGDLLGERIEDRVDGEHGGKRRQEIAIIDMLSRVSPEVKTSVLSVLKAASGTTA